jgi:hypothetical protein
MSGRRILVVFSGAEARSQKRTPRKEKKRRGARPQARRTKRGSPISTTTRSVGATFGHIRHTPARDPECEGRGSQSHTLAHPHARVTSVSESSQRRSGSNQLGGRRRGRSQSAQAHTLRRLAGGGHALRCQGRGGTLTAHCRYCEAPGQVRVSERAQDTARTKAFVRNRMWNDSARPQ